MSLLYHQTVSLSYFQKARQHWWRALGHHIEQNPLKLRLVGDFDISDTKALHQLGKNVIL